MRICAKYGLKIPINRHMITSFRDSKKHKTMTFKKRKTAVPKLKSNSALIWSKYSKNATKMKKSTYGLNYRIT